MAGIILLGVILCLLASKLIISHAAAEKTYSTLSNIPTKKAALLLGCRKTLSNGSQNLFFQHRIAAAAKLYHACKVKYIIASGDNSHHSYNEPLEMKQSLIASGVPAEAIYCDYAGFRTLDSVIRAREIFGQDDLIIISQKFHNERAIFIACQKGIKAIGFNAKDVNISFGYYTTLREYLACSKALLDVYLLRTKPKFLGQQIIIGQQNSAESQARIADSPST